MDGAADLGTRSLAVALALDRPVSGVLLDSAYASVARLFARGGLLGLVERAARRAKRLWR